MRIGLNAQLAAAGESGGIEQAVLGLLRGLSILPHGPELLAVVPRGDSRPHGLGAGVRLIRRPAGLEDDETGQVVPRSPSALADSAPRRLARFVRRAIGGSRSVSEWLRGQGVQVVHFPYQDVFWTDLPFVYSPWDLLHVREPRHLASAERERRERVYAWGCTTARVVITPTQAVRQDVMTHYSLPESRVVVIPAGVDALAARPSPRKGQLPRLPESFILYPAHGYAHKNHERLLVALAGLRDEGLEVPCVFTGHLRAASTDLTARARSLGIAGQVLALGYVPGPVLEALYSACLFLVFPSLFEGFGLPVIEAFAAGAPVVCSDIPPLRETAGAAALYFDPLDPASIGACIREMWLNEDLRRDLQAAGLQRASRFSWGRVAAAHVAAYKLAAGSALTDAEREGLGSFGNEVVVLESACGWRRGGGLSC